MSTELITRQDIVGTGTDTIADMIRYCFNDGSLFTNTPSTNLNHKM